MKRQRALWIGLAIAAALLASGGAWIYSLSPAPVVGVTPPITKGEADAMIAALKPPKRARPLIAIVGASDGSETTDYLMPYGILRRADIADVVALGTKPGPVTLYPLFKVAPDATLTEFDARYPDGADYVIVPAMDNRDDDPDVLSWLKSQAARGAIIIGVCAGAKVVANAGLLDGKRATTHWYYLKDMLDEHPAVRYVPDRRLVVDQGVATTTGITASMPMSLTLIEAIAGRAKAEAVAQGLGLTRWDALHQSELFQLTRPFALTVIGNRMAFWNREQLVMELTPGMDEVSLALVADAWSRTYRSRVVTFTATAGPVQTRHGARIFPDRLSEPRPPGRLLSEIGDRPPATALDDALRTIESRYGRRTADVVAMQLEYSRQSPAQ